MIAKAIQWDSIIPNTIAAILAGIFLALMGYFWANKIMKRFTLESFRLSLTNLPQKFNPPTISPGVLLARNDDGTLVNEVFWFRKRRHGRWEVLIWHKQRVGFQYKCFVEYAGKWDEATVMSELTEAGLLNPRKGEGKPNRIWFLRPNEPTELDSRDNTNNFKYPE